MSIPYLTIKRECALNLAQIAGVDDTSLEVAYAGLWTAALDGSEIPISSFKTKILDIEAELCHVIGSNVSHPYRTYIAGTSATLANLDDTPTTDATGASFVGSFGSCLDAVTGQPCTIQPTQTILNTRNSFFDTIELWNYTIVDNTIQHTRPDGVKLVGCVLDPEARSTAYDADGDSPLPPVLVKTWVAGVCGSASQVGWVDQSNAVQSFFAQYQQGIEMLKMGAKAPLSAADVVSG